MLPLNVNFDAKPAEETMNFDHNAQGNASQLSRLIVVAVLHALVGAGIVAGIKVRPHVDKHFMPDPITQIDRPLPTPVELPKDFDVTPIAPPMATALPLPAIDIAQPDVITEPSIPVPDKVAKGGGPVGAGGTGDAVKAVAKGKPILGKGSCETPAYPANAARDGATGTVRLSLLVGIHGRVTDARIEKTSGHRELDKAARTALSTCRFTPVTVDGVPEATWTVMEYIWTLDQ
jgi:protein TonB